MSVVALLLDSAEVADVLGALADAYARHSRLELNERAEALKHLHYKVAAQKDRPHPSATLRSLLAEVCDTHFECGDWRRDEADENYDVVSARGQVKLDAMLSRLALLEALFVEAYELMPLDGTLKRADWVTRAARSGLIPSLAERLQEKPS